MTSPIMEFVTGQPVTLLLAPTLATALGVSNPVDVQGARVVGSFLLVQVRKPDGSVDQYLLPPQSIQAARQTTTPPATTEPGTLR